MGCAEKEPGRAPLAAANSLLDQPPRGDFGVRAAPWWLPALPSDHVDINAGQAVVPRGTATFQFPTPSFYNSALFPQHSTCENHAYAATQLVRKRQRANQQASGSRSPQRSSTVQSRRADARGILEAEEGGEESDFAHVFLAQGRQSSPRGRRSQAPFGSPPRHCAQLGAREKSRSANRSQLCSYEF